MNKEENPKQYDLEGRTFGFAKNVRLFVEKLPKSLSNLEDIKQLIRSSGSVRNRTLNSRSNRVNDDFQFDYEKIAIVFIF